MLTHIIEFNNTLENDTDIEESVNNKGKFL
jgi:hypothetical protein